MMETLNVVGIAGDWHGNTAHAIKALNDFAARGIKVIFQLGDFGIWPGHSGASFIKKVEKTLAKNNQVLYVLPGNHDDYARINNTPVGQDGLQVYRPHIFLIPRGHRFNINGRVISVLGGANSIDYETRTPNLSWWKEESITLGDVYRTMEGGTADIMFAHDAPTGAPIPLNHRDSGWSPEGIAYAEDSRRMMRSAVDVVKPKLFLHGHYHVHYDIITTLESNYDSSVYQTRFVGLEMDDMPNSNAVLTIDTLELEFF